MVIYRGVWCGIKCMGMYGDVWGCIGMYGNVQGCIAIYRGIW